MARMTIRLDDHRHQQVKAAAEACGVAPATWAAAMVKEAAIRAAQQTPEDPADDIHQWRSLTRT